MVKEYSREDPGSINPEARRTVTELTGLLKAIAKYIEGRSRKAYVKSGSRNEFKMLLEYIDKTPVQVIMTSEISRIGRRVVDVLNFVELLHEKGIALYIQQFNMLTMENGKENPVAKMLLQMLAIGAEMENNQRKIRQIEGIQLAKLKGVYNGRVKGSRTSVKVLIEKYQNVNDLLDKSELSVRRIA